MISAPSGAGKSSLINTLLKLDNNLQLSISHTTRPMRPNESNGVQYHFVTETEFNTMLQHGQFVEHAKIYNYYYGTHIKTIQSLVENGNKDILLEIDYQGALQIKNLFPGAVLIFIMPPDLETLHARLKSRNTDSLESIQIRLNSAATEISYNKYFQYIN